MICGRCSTYPDAACKEYRRPCDPLLPLESRPLLLGIPGRFFNPPIAYLFDTDGKIHSLIFLWEHYHLDSVHEHFKN